MKQNKATTILYIVAGLLCLAAINLMCLKLFGDADISWVYIILSLVNAVLFAVIGYILSPKATTQAAMPPLSDNNVYPMDKQKKYLIWGAIGLAALALISLIIWLAIPKHKHTLVIDDDDTEQYEIEETVTAKDLKAEVNTTTPQPVAEPKLYSYRNDGNISFGKSEAALRQFAKDNNTNVQLATGSIDDSGIQIKMVKVGRNVYGVYTSAQGIVLDVNGTYVNGTLSLQLGHDSERSTCVFDSNDIRRDGTTTFAGQWIGMSGRTKPMNLAVKGIRF